MSETISLYTASTPNGYPVSILLEELNIDYQVKPLSFSKNEQKSPEYLKINPNGRIPAIVDNARNGLNVFETSAILLYLAQHYDKEHKLSYDPQQDPDLYAEQLSWLMWAHGGLGPMQGQSHHVQSHFLRYAPEDIDYAINRYRDEAKRLYGVLESHLEKREFVVGDRYGLADIKAFPWCRFGPWAGLDLADFPNVSAWIKRCEARPATEKGLAVPSPSNVQNAIKGAAQKRAEFQANFGSGANLKSKD